MVPAQAAGLSEFLNWIAELSPHELQSLPKEAREELDALLKPSDAPRDAWSPLPGPQTTALNSDADILLYGGAAGGGKSDLALGAALTRHSKSIIYRREGTQTVGLVDRLAELLGSRNGFNSQTGIWRLPTRADGTPLQIEFGSCPNPGDEMRYQGRPHDLIVFDEAVHFLEKQVRFLMGWNRTTLQGQRVRVILTSNPPTPEHARKGASAGTGLWIIRMFAPWLDPNHPRPAKPGELRWYATNPRTGGEQELPDDPEDPLFHNHGLPFWLESMDPRLDEPLIPRSRTFIPAKVTDNPFLVNTNYVSQLQALPEPLRSQMLYGDFSASLADNPMQVFPTAWVRLAVQRWKDQPARRREPMTSLGVDVSRGGRDSTVIARRHGWWFDNLITLPGAQVPDGPAAAGHALSYQRNDAPVIVDTIGIGASVYDHLVGNGVNAVAHIGSEKARGPDKSGKLTFANRRSEIYWRFREMLDPAGDIEVALPPDEELIEELLAVTWTLQTRGITVIPKDKLVEILGRSPDKADAASMAASWEEAQWDAPETLTSPTSRAATLDLSDPAYANVTRLNAYRRSDWRRPIPYQD